MSASSPQPTSCAGFEPWAGQIQVISEPSVHAPADAQLAFKAGWGPQTISF